MNEDVLSASEVTILKLAKNNELLKLKAEEKFRREFIGNSSRIENNFQYSRVYFNSFEGARRFNGK